ncbi:MAG: hypothetical protein ACAI44_37110 [Candidatus Sericytochromatia bacterium]
MTESLQDRKVKYQHYVARAEDLASDGEVEDALKAYRQALRYTLYKNETEQIQSRIQRLESLMGFVSGIPENEDRPKHSRKWLWIGAAFCLVALFAGIGILVVQPF